MSVWGRPRSSCSWPRWPLTRPRLSSGAVCCMGGEQGAAVAAVQQVLAGGDVLGVGPVMRVLRAPGARQVINGYGPTENTTFTCCFPMTAPEQVKSSVPIGGPIANTQVYVLDDQLQPVPIGVAGELYTGGVGLARGYHQRPGLTAAAFLPHPWSTEPGARLYKTGDLVRYGADGVLEFVGRRDAQVKIRGFRIEPGEIEALISQHPAVAATVLLARVDQPGEKRLVAYIVLQPESRVSAAELRRFVQAQLPAYMVPTAFVFLETLPLTSNGKVDRRLLPPPDGAVRGEEEGFVPPREPVESHLAQIWEDVLDVHPIGVKNNFFDLGGHSLLAVRLMAQIYQRFGLNLPIATLFQAPTVEQLARILRQQAGSSVWSPLVPIRAS